jgi:hypothetical protein
LLDEPPAEKSQPNTDAKARPKRQRGAGDIVVALKACLDELKLPPKSD